MSSYPNFSGYGYTISRELGQNLSGGRVTYLATLSKASLYGANLDGANTVGAKFNGARR